MILAINTAGPEIAICLYWPPKFQKVLKFKSEKRSENLLLKIDKLLKENNVSLKDLKTIVVNQGPGSFTGLRVGISTANTLGYVLKIPVIGVKNQKDPLKLAKQGYKKLQSGKAKSDSKVLPFYGHKIN